MTMPRLAPLLLLALLASGLAPGAAAQGEEPPVRVSLSHARLDMGPSFDAWTLLDAAVANPNGFPLDVELLVEDVPEPGVVGLNPHPRASGPARLEPGETRLFRVEMAAPAEAVGEHVLRLSVRAQGYDAPKTVTVPLRVHAPADWAAEAGRPGARGFTVHSVGDPTFFQPADPLRLEAEVSGSGAPATLLAEVVDPEGRFSKADPIRVPLFPGQRVRVSLFAIAAPDAPHSFETALRLGLEEEPGTVQTLPVSMRLPASAPAPGEAVPDPAPPGPIGDWGPATEEIVRLLLPEGPIRVAPGQGVEFVLPGLHENPPAHAVEVNAFAFHRNVTVEWGGAVPAPGWSGRVSPGRVDAGPDQLFGFRVNLSAPADAPPGERVVASFNVMLVGEGMGGVGRVVKVDVLVTGPAAAPPPAPAGEAAPWAPSSGAALAAAALLLAAVAGVGLLARRDPWRWAWLASFAPLYTRYSRERAMDHETRQELLRAIAASPGIHYRELKRRTGLNTGTLVHHLRTLEAQGHVASRREGALRRFYAVGEAPVPPAPAVPRTPVQERVLALLDERPMTQRELAERMELSQQGINHHVKALERKGLLASQPGDDGVHRWRRARPPAAER